MVHGRFRHRSWEKDGVQRCALEIEAFAVGHDLTRGVGAFTKATGPRREEFVDEQPAAASGAGRGRRRRVCRGIGQESSSSAA